MELMLERENFSYLRISKNTFLLGHFLVQMIHFEDKNEFPCAELIFEEFLWLTPYEWRYE